eukprot:gene2294-2513_t
MEEPAAKKSRTEAAAPSQPPNYAFTIASIVGNLPAILEEVENERSKSAKLLLPLEINEVELEIRVGMLISEQKRLHSRDQRRLSHMVDPSRKNGLGVEFVSGIDEILAKKIKEKFPKMGFTASPPTTTTILCTPSGERYSANGGNKGYSLADRKEKLKNFDLGMSSHDYDIRISLSSEKKSEDSDMFAVPYVNWDVQRKKKRTTFVHQSHSFWQVDLTEVVSQYKDPTLQMERGNEKEIELEFELRNAILEQWLNERDERKKMTLANQICQQLVGLIDIGIPCEPESDQSDLLVAVNKNDVSPDSLFKSVEFGISEMNSHLDPLRYPVQVERRRMDFVGSMPVNLFRKNLTIVLETDYFLTEKTDGTRYLLYSMPASDLGPRQSLAVMFDRARTAFTFPGSELLPRAIGEGTLLDGELVYNLQRKKSVFMVFDVLMYKGQSYVDHPFAERLAVITQSIIPNYNSFIQQHASEKDSIQLLSKKFVKKAEINVLLGNIIDQHGERVYRDKEGRHHFTDGIIFQPNSRYVFSKHYDLLKWKWADLRSVDLVVSMSENGGDLQFLCMGPNEGLINCSKRGERNVGVGQFDSYRLRKEMFDLQVERTTQRSTNTRNIGRTPIIAEVTYDVQLGMWVYKKVRKDKTESNYIDSVLGVFIEQAEAISREELEYALVSATAGTENDYEYQLSKMKTKLLDWQRSQQRPSARK